MRNDRNERGSVLVYVTIALVVILGFTAFAIDGGRLYLGKSDLQNAADAAALAGAQYLPNAGAAESAAKDYAELNGAERDNTFVNPSYKGDPNKIEVVCKSTVPFSFAKILGFKQSDVSSRAVAQRTSALSNSGLFNYALFSGEGNVGMTGNSHVITGDVYGKTGISIAGNKSTMSGNAVSAGTNINVPSGVTKIPNTTVPFPTNLPALIEAQGLELKNGTIKDGESLNGIFYYDGDITINGRIKGTAIIYANGGDIKFASGVKQTNTDSVMFYSSGDFTFNGGCGDVYGILYAPNGGFTNNGGPNGNVNGRIITKNNIQVNGSKFSVTARSNDLDGFNLLQNISYKLIE